MEKLLKIFYGITGIIFLAGIGYFFYQIIMMIILNIEKINANLFIGILGATVTITGYFITRYFERAKMIEVEIRNKKIPVYEEFMNFYFNMVQNQKEGEKIENDDIVDFFRGFNQKAIVWFPDNILKAYINWRNNLVNFSQSKSDLKQVILDQEEFMKDIRVDIGHKNKDIEKWEISSLYINDIKDFVKDSKT